MEGHARKIIFRVSVFLSRYVCEKFWPGYEARYSQAKPVNMHTQASAHTPSISIIVTNTFQSELLQITLYIDGEDCVQQYWVPVQWRRRLCMAAVGACTLDCVQQHWVPVQWRRRLCTAALGACTLYRHPVLPCRQWWQLRMMSAMQKTVTVFSISVHRWRRLCMAALCACTLLAKTVHGSTGCLH